MDVRHVKQKLWPQASETGSVSRSRQMAHSNLSLIDERSMVSLFFSCFTVTKCVSNLRLREISLTSSSSVTAAAAADAPAVTVAAVAAEVARGVAEAPAPTSGAGVCVRARPARAAPASYARTTPRASTCGARPTRRSSCSSGNFLGSSA